MGSIDPYCPEVAGAEMSPSVVSDPLLRPLGPAIAPDWRFSPRAHCGAAKAINSFSAFCLAPLHANRGSGTPRTRGITPE
jgi:hypothetical protein